MLRACPAWRWRGDTIERTLIPNSQLLTPIFKGDLMRRNIYLPVIVVLIGMLLLSAALTYAYADVLFDREPAVITLNPGVKYQTITGWEAVAQAGQFDCPGFSQYSDKLFDQVVNDLGINRIRLEIQSGAENTPAYWTGHLGQLRFATVNDNNDPAEINWAGFQFDAFDQTVEQVVLPLKQRLEARGERLFININYVAFTNKLGPRANYHHDNPAEYAEFVLATYLHMQSKYGLVPDSWEILLEPDNVLQWDGRLMGQAVVAAAARLTEHGFTPAFVAPSTTAMSNALPYFEAMIAVPGAGQYVKELTYHRYWGVSGDNLQAIAAKAGQYRLNTAMLEHIGSGYEDLHQDLKVGMNSAWQQFALAYCTKDDGAQYYPIDTSNPAEPVITMGYQTRFLRQYFKFVRSGAVRIEAGTTNNKFDPVAFINANGKYVVVIKTNRGGAFTVAGLPAGSYGLKYTTSSEYDVNLPDITLESGQNLEGTIPAAGVITVFAM